MADMLGRTVSHYDILEKVGEGGMGAVYRARDTSLDRLVALKVLPPDRVTDPERRARFVQEARAASALNHPNIVTVYEIGSHDDVHFIAMEYVEGETLDHLTGRRGLPLRQAVDYAIQIADGMGTAHAAGIIHRDLKPSNILVTKEGRVKILDFGLAKLAERQAAVDEGATRTTVQPHLTEQGQIVGTIAYMSPEQVGGGRLDTRSDIFSFGIVLYEMVAGRRPFEGGSNASTLQAILSKNPTPPSDVVGVLPFELERAILRCLRKEPQRRWQTMGDLKVALEDLRDDLQSGKVSQVGVAAIAPPRRRRLWVLATAVGAPLLLLAALAGAWRLLRPASQAPALEAERVTFEGTAVIPPAISSDGKLIVYSALRDGWYNLFVQQLGGGVRQAARLTQHESNDSFPSFSPDGLSVVYRSERDGGGLFVVDTLGVAGRAERKLADGGHYPSVSPDGASIAYIVPEAQAARGRVEVVPIGGGTARRIGSGLVAIKVGNTYVPPLWSPDSASVLFRAMRGQEAATRGWWVASISGTDAAPLEGMPPDPRWQARGALAWWQDAIYYVEGEPTGGTTLFRVRVKSKPWRTAGPPEKIASPAGFAIGNSVSKDGRAVFTSVTGTTNVWSAALGPDKLTTGPLQRMTSDSMGKRGLTATEDGSRIAYASYTYSRLRGVEVRIRDTATGRETLIAGSGTFPFLDPVLNADGSMLAYRDRPEQEILSYLARAGEPGRRLCSACEVMGFFRDTPDALTWTQEGLMRQPLAGGPPSLIIEEQPEPYITHLALSPSGKWLALTRAAPPDGSATLWLADLSRGVSKPGEWRLLAEDRNYLGSPAWSRDGTVLYYLSRLDGFNCLWGRRLKPDGTPSGPAVPVLHLHTQHPVWEFSGQRRVAVTNDRIFVLVDDVTGDAWSMKLQP